MNLVSKPTTTRLATRGILELCGRAGDRVDCLHGSVWITQDGDPRDLVLDGGQSFTLDRTGPAIVYALTEAGVAVRRAAPRSMHVSTSAVRRLRELMAAPKSASASDVAQPFNA